jgi:hypothetical protein
MHLNRLLVLPLLLMAVARPATALDLRGAVSSSLNSDGSICFSATPSGPATGLATASGVVHPGAPLPVGVPPSLRPVFEAIAGPPQPFAAAVPLVTTGGGVGVCLGGIGRPVSSGSATYTFNLHGTASDYATVIQCTFTFGSATCV